MYLVYYTFVLQTAFTPGSKKCYQSLKTFRSVCKITPAHLKLEWLVGSFYEKKNIIPFCLLKLRYFSLFWREKSIKYRQIVSDILKDYL